jgi:dihydroxyacetone kinase phosphotransfer subunit
MVSLLLLSHSAKIVEGTRELALQMAGDAGIAVVGGAKDGSLGADFDVTLETLRKLVQKGDVIVLADLGSARMTGQMAAEALDVELQKRVHLCDAALVEGGLVAAIAIAAGQDAEAVLEQLQEYVLNKE